MSKKVTIYVPDELHAQLKEHADLNMAAICRQALRDALGSTLVEIPKPVKSTRLRVVETPAKGTQVVATDLATGYTETVVIVDDYNLICDGTTYLASAAMHQNGTHQLTIKGRKS